MSHNLLKGKKGIIFGALDEKSLAWRTALRCHEEGAQLVLTNAPVALRLGEINKLAEAVNAPVIAADVTNMDDLKSYSKILLPILAVKLILYCTQ
jgi:enoyl-[acyl-carrier protein] reductase I